MTRSLAERPRSMRYWRRSLTCMGACSMGRPGSNPVPLSILETERLMAKGKAASLIGKRPVWLLGAQSCHISLMVVGR